jgi:hypothetical protein
VALASDRLDPHSRIYFAIQFFDDVNRRARWGTYAGRSTCLETRYEISHHWDGWNDLRSSCCRNCKSAQPTSLDVFNRGRQIVEGALHLPTNEVAQHRSGTPIRHVDGFHTGGHFEKFASDMREGASSKRRHRNFISVYLEVVDEFRNVSGRDCRMNFQNKRRANETSNHRHIAPKIVV